MLLTMEIIRATFLLLSLCVCWTFCFPSKPLNERSTELAWQAWLLVDNHNNRYDPENPPRRRITPKSVFIAPTFSPESLPACADGYRPDSMGRCVKIIKLDEEAHLDFLLEKLNAQFADYEDAEDSQEGTTPGPFQINIPLGGEDLSTRDQSDELGIAIVVAPTKDDSKLEDEIKSAVNLLNGNFKASRPVLTRSNFPLPSTNTKKNTDSTTSTAEETSTLAATQETITNSLPTESEETTVATTTAPFLETDSVPQNALFFAEPPTSTEEGKTDTPTSSFGFEEEGTTLRIDRRHLAYIRFPEESKSETNNSEISETPSQPQAPLPSHAQIPEFRVPEAPMHSQDSLGSLLSEYIRGTDIKDEKFVFKSPTASLDQTYNRRNRDKHSSLWSLPVNNSSLQKPIVLRFSRRSNDRRYLEEHIIPRTGDSQAFYREVPREDFSYIFGNRRTSARDTYR